jgi:transcriptional regulator with XRE-family HTH domain
MVIGDRLRDLRIARNLTQGEVGRRTGLKGSYISRVESGYIVPGIENLEKIVRALNVPLYGLFYDSELAPVPGPTTKVEDLAWGATGKDARLLKQFRQIFSQIEPDGRALLLQIARKMAKDSRENKKR